MFNTSLLSSIEKLESQKEALEEKVKALELETEKLKLKKKMDEEDLRHLIKMREEKSDIEFQKKVMELERELQNKNALVKDEYKNKLEERLQTEVENMKEMYSQILGRLPNINAHLKGTIDG